jgi:hypothetical protein
MVYKRLGGTKGALREEDYIFYRKENENHQLGTGHFIRHRIVSTIKKVEFFNHRISYIVLRGRCSNINVLNAHEPTEEKPDD